MNAIINYILKDKNWLKKGGLFMKKHFSFLVLLITFVCLPATAFMAPLNYEGEPDMLNPNHILGAFAWHNNVIFPKMNL